MNRTLFVGFLMLAVVSTVLHGCKREEVVPKGIEMQLVPSQTQYRLDEDIVVKVKLTNQGDKPCQIIPTSDAIIHVVTLTRAGVPLNSEHTHRTHFIEYERFIREKLVQLEPHTSRTLSWKGLPGTSSGIGVVFLTAPDIKTIERWLVDQVGIYTIKVKYTLPASLQLPPDMCQAGTDPVTITFTVTPE